MKNQLSILVLCLLLIVACDETPTNNTSLSNANTATLADGLELSTPIQFKNLQLWLVQGEDQYEGEIKTLEEAMDERKFIVYETGSVNELTVRNKSEAMVFVHSGDIVKGGKQDRVLEQDAILAARSRKYKIGSFCVEQSRWAKRGNEAIYAFGSSKKMISNLELKVASRYHKNQSSVWNNVAKQQTQLNDNLSFMMDKEIDVRSNASNTSLQLALENKDLKNQIERFKEAINPEIETTENAIGLVVAINGEINSAEIYAQKALFQKLMPKLLESYITEAISKYQQTDDTKELTENKAITFLNKAKGMGKTKVQEAGMARVKYKDFTDQLFAETIIKVENKWQWIHKSHLFKSKADAVPNRMEQDVINMNNIVPQQNSGF